MRRRPFLYDRSFKAKFVDSLCQNLPFLLEAFASLLTAGLVLRDNLANNQTPAVI